MPDEGAMRPAVIADFLARHGWGAAERRPLAGDASFRRYDRLTRDGARAVLMDAPPPHEDVRPFRRLADHLTGLGFSAPKVWAADPRAGLLLLEDLGDDTYGRCLAAGADETALYTLAVDTLAALHHAPGVLAVDVPEHDAARRRAEVDLVLEWFWPAAFGGAAPTDIAAEWAEAWDAVLAIQVAVPRTLVLFDYHIDNLLWLRDRPGVRACGLLDFQDAKAGPASLDLVSLLEDVRRDVPPDLQRAMIARYLAATGLDPDAFAAAYAIDGAQRNSRILGTFTRLWRRDGKPRYLDFLPRVWRLLDGDLAHPVCAPVRAWFARHVPAQRRELRP